MIENSRLTKELQDIVKDKMPANIVSQEMAEKCLATIATILGPTARGSLLDEITFLCNEFMKISNEYIVVDRQSKQLSREKESIEKAVKGDDVDENHETTQLIKRVIRLRGVLEVIKTRLDRLSKNCNQSEIADLRKNVADFLSENC